ncbi:SanA protein [Arenibacter nanhaiticus]|uniref:SanA protein n=1 Tax=Arenibacter nanhaiticus TaxID=558155 RepID=A0A1M6M5Z9_9FLAO|nr:ElyC/SanA/YdcF family protein [Arenibacter nanhaiticus]SHJ78924.1 SanA protein [Arenibacter nanhaiticus]
MKKSIAYTVLILLTGISLVLTICHYLVEISTEDKTYWNIHEIPNNNVGLVLGTSHKLIGGKSNPYYTNRIQATINLFKAGKIDFILVSGDNSSRYYNEPKVFRRDLIKGGIPANKIFMDYAGFRTLDSIVRAQAVFGLDQLTVISQEFHNERAIYLAKKKGIDVIGFNARDIDGKSGQKVRIREYFARVKLFVDLALNTQPKFFGEKVDIK